VTRAACVAVLCAALNASGDELARLSLPNLPLPSTDGRTFDLHALPSTARVTVLTFFSAHCPCQAIHDSRLVQLASEYQTQGVQFFAVDSEDGSSLEADKEEAARRRYPFPILRDEGGRLAKALDVHFATGTVIVDSQGTVRYRGGIDTDKRSLHEDAKPYLKSAIDSVLAGRDPQPAEPKSLGCYLLGT
jgi:peroxiredoxin